MDENDILGIKIGLDFENEGESEAKLKEAISELQDLADESKIKLNVDLNSEKAQSQLDSLKTILEETGSAFGEAFKGGIGVEGLTKVLSTLEEINALTKESQDRSILGNVDNLGEIIEGADKIKTAYEEAGDSAKEIASKISSVYDANGNLLKVTEEYRDALGQTETVVKNLADSSKSTTTITLDNLKQTQLAYKNLEEAMEQVAEMEQKIADAKKDGVSETGLDLLNQQLELYKQQEQEAKDYIKNQDLTNEALEKELNTKQELASLETKYNNNVEKEAEKLSTINDLLKQRYEIQQRLAKDSYLSEENKANDIAERDALTRTINNRKKNLPLSSRAEVDETLEDYNADIERIKNDTSAKNEIAIAKEEEELAQTQFNTVKSLLKEEQALRLANIGEKNNNIAELNNEKIASLLEQREAIGTENFNPEQLEELVLLEEEGIRKLNIASERALDSTQKGLLNSFKNLLSQEKALANEINKSNSVDRTNILNDQQNANEEEQNTLLEQMNETTKDIALNWKNMLETGMESLANDKEQVTLLKAYASNLKEINSLKRQEDNASENGEYQLSLIEKENSLLEENKSIYEQLDEANQQQANIMAQESEEIQRATDLKQNDLQIQREQNNLLKEYVSTLKQEDSLNKQLGSANSDLEQRTIESRINSLLEERAEIYSQMTEKTQACADSELAVAQAERETIATEQEENARIEEQATLYKELLDLETQRVNIETKYVQTGSSQPYKIQELINEYRELTSAIEEKNKAISELGLEDSDLAEENSRLLENTNAWRNLQRAEADNLDTINENKTAIDELGDSLSQLAEKYGRLVTATSEYKSIQEGLGTASMISDIDSQEVAISNLTDRIRTLGTTAETEEAEAKSSITNIFNSAKFTITSMATQGLIGSFDQAWDTIKEINRNFAELKKVYDPNLYGNNGYNVNNFLDVANQMGSEMGFNTADTVDAIYQAMNYGFGNKTVAENIAKASMLLSNSGQIAEKEASTDIISILKAFKIDNPDAMVNLDGKEESAIQSVVDQLSFGGMNFPITSGGIGEALQRGGSALANQGNTLQQAIEMIIAGNMTRQDPAVVGNSMKSIAGSFTDILLGDTKADILNKSNLHKILPNFQWFNANGQLKSTYQILTGIAKLYKEGKISPNNLQWLASIIGGKTQLGVVTSLIKNLGNVEDKYGTLTSEGAGVAGSAERENKEYLDSLVGKLAQLKDTVDKLWMDVIKTSDATKIIQFGTDFVKVLDLIIQKLGVLKTLAIGIGAFALFKNRNSFDTMGKATLNTFKALLNIFRKLKGLDPLEMQKLKEDPNDKIASLLDKKKEALTKGFETGEAYADGIAEGIENNTSIQEAIDSKLNGNEELLPNNNEEESNINPSEIIADEEESAQTIGKVDEEVKSLDKDLVSEKELNIDTLESQENLSEIDEKINEIDESLNKEKDLNINSDETKEGLIETEEKIENVEEDASKSTVLNIDTVNADEKLITTDEEAKQVKNDLGEDIELTIEDSEAIDSLTTLDKKIEEVEEKANKTTEINIDTSEAETKISELESNINSAKSEASEVNIGEEATGAVEEEAEAGVESRTESTMAESLLDIAGMTAEGVIGTATAGIGIFAIPLIIAGVEKLVNANKELEASNQKVYSDATQEANNYQNQIQSLSDFENSANGKKLAELNSQYQAGKLNTTQTQDYFNLLKQVAKIAPETVAFKDANGNPYINMTNGVKGLISDLKQLKQQEDATLVDPTNVSNFWKEIANEQKSTENAEKVFNTESAEGTFTHVDDEVGANFRDGKYGSDLAKAIQQEESEFNQAEQTLTSFQNKFKQQQQAIIKDIVNPHIEDSVNTSGLSDKVKQEYEKFLDGLNLSQVTKTQMNDIFSKLDSEVSTTAGQKIITSLTSTMNKLKEEYASGEIDYTQFANKMGTVKNELINKLHLTPEEASELTNANIWREAGSSEKAFVTTMTDTANSVGYAGQKMQTAFQTQYRAFNSFLTDMQNKTQLGKQKIQEDIKEMFTISPEAGHSLEEKLGISMKTSLSSVAKAIGSNSQLQQDFAQAMAYITTGQPIPDSVKNKLDSELKTVIVDSVKSATSSGNADAKIKTTVEPDNKAGAIGSADGLAYANGVKETGKQKGDVLSDTGAGGIGSVDGTQYADGVLGTAKGQGKVLSDGNAGGIGSADGLNWKGGLQSSAIGQGRVTQDGSAYGVGQSDGSSWYSGFMSVVDGVGSAISDIVRGAEADAKSIGLFVIPSVKVNTNSVKTKITEAHRELTSYTTKLFSSRSVAHSSGGVSSGGKGGKGSKGGGAVGGVSAVTNLMALPTESIDTSIAPTGISEDENLFSFLPSDQSFYNAGSNAGMSYASGLSQANNYVIQSEITQTERLQEIQNEYFNTSSNGLKLNIDLNQRLKNALTDVGNALQENQSLQQQSTTNGNETIDLLNQEINLLNQKKQLNENILSSYQQQLADMKNSLQNEGISFDSNGNILNAVSRLQQLESWINNIPSSVKDTSSLSSYGNYNIPTSISNLTRQQAEQTIQNIQSMVQAYEQMLHTTIPETEQTITDTQNSVNNVYNNMLQTASNVENQITQIIQKQIAERKQAIQNEAQTQVNALNTTLQNLEQQHNQQTYQTTLKQQYQQLQQLQEQINDAELDHSLNGQATLKQLKEEYQNQQDQINQTISNEQYQNAQTKIQNEINSIDSNAQTEEQDLENEWTPQKIASTVQQAMKDGSFKDVEGNIVSVQQAWIEFANEFDDGLGVMGNKLKDDFLAQLQEAQKIMQNIQTINKNLGYYNTSSATPTWVTPNSSNSTLFRITPSLTTPTIKTSNQTSNSSAINFNAPLLEVKGSVGSASELDRYSKNLEVKVTDYIVKNLRNRGIM